MYLKEKKTICNLLQLWLISIASSSSKYCMKEKISHANTRNKFTDMIYMTFLVIFGVWAYSRNIDNFVCQVSYFPLYAFNDCSNWCNLTTTKIILNNITYLSSLMEVFYQMIQRWMILGSWKQAKSMTEIWNWILTAWLTYRYLLYTPSSI